MSYTAIENMRRINMMRFKEDLGPMQPPFYTNEAQPNELKCAALRFLRERCEGLCFNKEIEKQEAETGIYKGKSLKAGQIPYNMQMDLNRLCLEKALESFVDSGVAEDAYAVYYCYLEIFFGQYGKSKKMVELLSEYEVNGSALLMKHRDHYAHSVYVFALGLAIYETNENFRKTFGQFYNLDPEGNSAANLFLEFWGLTALFHDIGYPFELPFEQVLSYFEADNKKREDGLPYMAYHSVNLLTGLDDASKARFQTLYRRSFSTTSELLAYDIARKLGEAYGFTESYMLDEIELRPTRPSEFGYHMDHAFFSAARLCQELIRILTPKNLTEKHVDALSAIMLHNSLFKFSVAFYKDPEKRKEPMHMELHPLAWLLMLCDELQCWDRTAYGRSSRTELHPLMANFDFKDQAIYAVYYYDNDEQESVEAYEREYNAWRVDPMKKKPRLRSYSDMLLAEDSGKSDFAADIERIVDTSSIPLTVVTEFCTVDRENKHTYLSGCNFLHYYDFAVALHARNMPADTSVKDMEDKFHASSLEYQLSTLGRTRYFARYLNALGCFYTDMQVDFDLVTEFTEKDMDVIAPAEHARWVREHQAMGWRYGEDYQNLPLKHAGGQEKDDFFERSEQEKAKLEDAGRATLREQLRCHRLCMDGMLTDEEIQTHFWGLSKKDQNEDKTPFNVLITLLKKFDGTRIYRIGDLHKEHLR